MTPYLLLFQSKFSHKIIKFWKKKIVNNRKLKKKKKLKWPDFCNFTPNDPVFGSVTQWPFFERKLLLIAHWFDVLVGALLNVSAPLAVLDWYHTLACDWLQMHLDSNGGGGGEGGGGGPTIMHAELFHSDIYKYTCRVYIWCAPLWAANVVCSRLPALKMSLTALFCRAWSRSRSLDL